MDSTNLDSTNKTDYYADRESGPRPISANDSPSRSLLKKISTFVRSQNYLGWATFACSVVWHCCLTAFIVFANPYVVAIVCGVVMLGFLGNMIFENKMKVPPLSPQQ